MIKTKYSYKDWIPTSADEVKKRGWNELDVILFTGDAYIDHPAFGIAVIARLLEKKGLKVAVVPQPNWRDDLRDFKKLGKPNLFFGVTSGNMDSMINHYTANKRLRSDDAYTPGNKAGFRPDYATIVYSKILKSLFPEVPLLIGGIEASLRRLTHYDYWSDALKPSVLIESKADLLVYGMGEKPLLEITDALLSGCKIEQLRNIHQTAYIINQSDFSDRVLLEKNNTKKLYSYEECRNDKVKFALNFKTIEQESNRFHPATLIEPVGDKLVIVNPPYEPLSEKETDEIYNLPFTRLPHPRYDKKLPIPAFTMIKDSVTLHRGCFGGCSFCTISAHQGKFVSSRSEASILREIDKIIHSGNFGGHITDLGGPSANMYKMKGLDTDVCKKCKRPSCIFPSVCKNLDISHKPLLELYRSVRQLKGIKKVSIGSGIRYDLFLGENGTFLNKVGKKYFEELITYHVSGRLKVAPEHSSERVLKGIRKPSFRLFELLCSHFERINRENNLNQQIIPYLISALPYCTINDMKELSQKTMKLKIHSEQVQQFTPTPMTLASAIYYSGIDPYTMKPVYIAKTRKEKEEQHRYLFRHS